MDSKTLKYLITDKIHPSARPLLEALDIEVDWFPDITNEEVAKIIHQYDGIIISTKTIINKSLIDKATKLKVVGRVGSGMDHIDQVYCKSNGIECFSSPEGNCNAVAEHAMAMLLAQSNHLIRANYEVKNGIWKRFENTGFELEGKTIGIIGYGHTGSAFARKLSGFEAEVLVYDKYKRGFGNESIHEVNFETIVKKAEVISFHIPYNKETHHWINREFVENCAKQPIIINTSRGAIANTEDLLWALQSKKLRGLCLDVFEDEPLNSNNVNPLELYQKIMAFDNVIVTPHIAGWTDEAKQKLVSILVKKIEEKVIKQGKR
ncbi:MAG: NAD(P)-dependent oxidoreductase [Chitinophagales bacterium]